jgi:hypothetical protein
MHMFRSESPVLKRWYAYLQTFDFEMFHISSDANSLVDCLSRYVHDPLPVVASVPKLLAAIKAVPAPSLLRCGDVESQPGPPAPAAFKFPAKVAPAVINNNVPAPSLLICGDVESHPGPPKANGGQAADDVVNVSSDSPSTDTTPAKRRSRRQGASPATDTVPSLSARDSSSVATAGPARSASARDSSAAATAGSARSASALDSSAAAADGSTPAPSPPSNGGNASDQESVHFDDSSSEYAPPISQTVWLQPHAIEAGPNSLCTALSEALFAENSRKPDDRSLKIPFNDLDIRERVSWFFEQCSSQPMTIYHGRSFQQNFKNNRPILSFSSRDDTRVPDTWLEYKNLMANSCTYTDLIFLQAAAVVYACQVVLFTEHDDCYVVDPGNAFRRIFLFASEESKHFNWGSLSPYEEDTQPEDATQWTFAALPLFSAAEFTPRPLSFPRVLDISDERLHALHEAHNAYTGHPGVEATVKILLHNGKRWRKMTAHVAQFVKRCPTCCSSRLNMLHTPVSAATLRLPSRPLRRWHVDQTGAMGTCSCTGFTRMIVFVCEVTQFVALYGSRYGTALETAVALINLMGWTGLAEALHSDGGSENDNFIWHQITQITGIKHSYSVPYVPQSNGIAERSIGTAKRFLRALTVDLDKHHAWGLLLPIAQKGMNDLPREDLHWFSPNQIVFASLHDETDFVIPTFYTRQLRQLDYANANGYPVSGNFAHRAMCFQQHVTNTFHEIKADAFEAAARRNPVAFTDVTAGQCVLIDWPGGQPPTPLHPSKRGPYRVTVVNDNTITLVHLVNPPPADQRSPLLWNKHAHVYQYVDDTVPARDAFSPSASQVPAGPPTRCVDCILSHTSKPASQLRHGRGQSSHVEDQIYEGRLCSTSAISTSVRAQPDQIGMFRYHEIAHTFAFDTYIQANRHLTGHVPVNHMPANWSPQAAAPSLRPAFAPLPIHEQQLPADPQDLAVDVAREL